MLLLRAIYEQFLQHSMTSWTIFSLLLKSSTDSYMYENLDEN